MKLLRSKINMMNSEMTFFEHLAELRARLLVVFSIIFFIIRLYIF